MQIEPRASWIDLAPVVGADAGTLARHWEALRRRGDAWITGHPRHGQLALVELECEPSRLSAVMASLEHDPQVWVLDLTSGSRDLLVTVFARDLPSLSAYVIPRIGDLPGVRSARTHIVGEVLVEGSSWRLRALAKDEAARVPAPAAPRPRAARRIPDEVRRAVETELWRDGRATVAEIARRHDVAPQRVSDAIATMRQRGELMMRTDLARGATGWPVYTWYFVEAPARTVEAARTTIAGVPEVRLAVTTSSRYNLVLAVWLRRLSDVNRFEIALERALPGARIADRSVVLRIASLMGRPLDEDGRVRPSA
ncbi:Lrp/AsnC family transcriptional regulator [Microbacterium sp. gxy059]|uniref:Lrp/AsnC family transcriptional regulator n=1 Tax=Microbacterium sp. gxy059 TaxID=2957199 RepID=UPI003D964706